MASDEGVRLEDIPLVNFGTFVLDKIKSYGDQIALVRLLLYFSLRR